MISSLRGTVLDVSLTGATITVGGVGLFFLATPATLAGLRPGREGLAAASAFCTRPSPVSW